MANLFVRSTDGNNADSGATWALAKLDLAGAAAIDAAGDTIFVSDAHAESTAAAITIALAGTVAAPTKIICGDDVAEPPTATATTGTVTTTGASNITISGTNYYIYGLSFFVGSGAVAAFFLNNGTDSVFESCSFQIPSTDGGNTIRLNNTTGARTLSRNCTFKFAAAGQSIDLRPSTFADIIGGSLLSGGTSPTNFFTPQAPSVTHVSGFDFSAGAAAINICSSTTINAYLSLRNCKLPASWTGSLNASTPGAGSVYELHNCDSADTNYRYWKKTQFGDITHETTIIKTGGASDGTTGIAWKMVSNANAEFPHNLLGTSEIVRWNETVGSAVTVTMDIIHDSLTNIQDDEIWLEVQYLGTAGFPLGSFIDDAAADVLATPADQTDSSATWTTTGLTNPNTQKLNVTFTPQEKGFIHAVVHLGLASKTVYVDPVLQVS